MSVAAVERASSPWGLFGKVPAQGDFLRLGVASPAAQALVGWLHEAIEPVHRAGAALPSAPVRFLFRGARSPEALVGTMVASRDRVGRAFPLCAFTRVPARALAAAFPGLPGAADALCAAAEALLQRPEALEPGALPALVGALPGAADPAASHAALAAEAAGLPAAAVLEALPDGGAAYALATFEAALGPHASGEPERAPVAVDAPARREVERWFWLELARRLLAWPAPPVLLWTSERLLVSPGVPPATALQHLCAPARPPSKIWPLVSERPEALAAARARLAPAATAALAGGSAAALLDALAGGGVRG